MKKQITFRTTNNLWSKFKTQIIINQNDVEYEFDQELEFLKLRTNFHFRIEHSDINSQLISQVQFNNNKRSEKSTYDKSLNLKFKLFERSILIEYLKLGLLISSLQLIPSTSIHRASKTRRIRPREAYWNI